MVLQNKIWALEVLSPIGEASFVGMVTLLHIYHGYQSVKRRDFPSDLINIHGPLMEDDKHGCSKLNSQRTVGQSLASLHG